MDNKKKTKVSAFFKKYGYYLTAMLLVVGITLSIVFSTVDFSGEIPDGGDVPSGTTPIVFALPVQTPEVLKGYSEVELFYNKTLNRWESHKGVDLTSANANVYAVADGKVSNIVDSYENGKMITITHSQGFVSVYSSLGKDVKVAEGDTITKGAVLGAMSESAANEQSDGAHLHFELFKNGDKVDPSSYITLENK